MTILFFVRSPLQGFQDHNRRKMGVVGIITILFSMKHSVIEVHPRPLCGSELMMTLVHKTKRDLDGQYPFYS